MSHLAQPCVTGGDLLIPLVAFLLSTGTVFTCFLPPFRSVYNTRPPFCFLCVTPPIDLPQSQTSWLGMLPPGGPERPVFSTPLLHLSLGLSAGREQEGCGGLKGRTPDGHRHVGHVLCDGLWLWALWASHSCQSSLLKVLRNVPQSSVRLPENKRRKQGVVSRQNPWERK